MHTCSVCKTFAPCAQTFADVTRPGGVADLKRHLDRHALAYAKALNFDLARKPRLDNLWVNVLKPGGGHSGHIHPHAFLSGTVYVEVPDGASALKLEDPRLPFTDLSDR